MRSLGLDLWASSSCRAWFLDLGQRMLQPMQVSIEALQILSRIARGSVAAWLCSVPRKNVEVQGHGA